MSDTLNPASTAGRLFKSQGEGGLSRRDFLLRAAAVGGTGLLMASMKSWGVNLDSILKAPPKLSGSGRGKRVVILGAGLAGMVAAYELGKLGYTCEILEARSFAGGRCQTARRGFELTELGGERQVCNFDEGQYINHGPWRIPFGHQSTLHYAKELGVPLELFHNDNDAAYVYRENMDGPLKGKHPRRAQIKADMRGHVDELFAKSLQAGRLDDRISATDKQLLLEYLINEGALNKSDLAYRGTNAGGYKVPPGVVEGELEDPLQFSQLLQSKLGHVYSAANGYTGQNAMFQAVGGMDRFAREFEKRVGQSIRLNTEIVSLRNTRSGVTVQCKDTQTGATRTVQGDFCLCTIPLSVLTQMDTDFSAPFKEAMKVAYVPTGKMGIQMKRRFWEEDDFIYGGHISTDTPGMTMISLPSSGWQGQKGTVLGYYNFGGQAARISAMSPKERMEFALAGGEKIFPGVYRASAEASFSVAWHRVKYNVGGWANWSEDARRNGYPLLLKGEGRTLLAGEHLSYLNGWMAGAIESSWHQIEQMHKRLSS